MGGQAERKLLFSLHGSLVFLNLRKMSLSESCFHGLPKIGYGPLLRCPSVTFSSEIAIMLVDFRKYLLGRIVFDEWSLRLIFAAPVSHFCFLNLMT